MSKETVKTQIDTDITNKTTSKSISPSNVGNNMKAVVDLIPNESHKVYTALLSQISTNAPVATILENTLEGTVIFSYSEVGSYIATLTGAFVLNKTWCSITSTASANVTVTAGRGSDNTVNINSFLSGTLTNSIMSPVCLEIRVYN